MPLFVYYHGQCDDIACTGCEFPTLAEKHGFMYVLPEGLDDGTGCVNWNVGSCGRTDVCTKQAQPSISDSCKITGNTSKCSWTTCYDDFNFASELLMKLQDELCIDQDQIFLSGSSNGGMLGYQLLSRLPIFAGFVPWYGAYLKNMRLPPPPATSRPMTLTAMHGLKDVTIPWSGGESYDHFLYVSGNVTQEAFRQEEGCGTATETFTTPYDAQGHGPLAFTCTRYTSCAKQAGKAPATVGRCLWPKEEHGFSANSWERLTWWSLTGQQ
jgi:poly(3-hydroxybutyrate) depolymerase